MNGAPTDRATSRRHFLIGGGAAAVAAAVGSVPVAAARAASTAPLLFGYSEIGNQNLKPFVKWTGTLDRYFAERELEEAPCSATTFNKCHLRQWKAFLVSIQAKAPAFQINSVQRYMNQVRYIRDPINYGVKDYWATPKQFFWKNGDCEDYAIAKYLSLRALGHTPERMRIVVLQDLNLRIAHAVLALYRGHDILILDNQVRQVVAHERIRHYRPIYSINEFGWWRHRKA